VLKVVIFQRQFFGRLGSSHPFKNVF
jgi:hypothetical protein